MNQHKLNTNITVIKDETLIYPFNIAVLCRIPQPEASYLSREASKIIQSKSIKLISTKKDEQTSADGEEGEEKEEENILEKKKTKHFPCAVIEFENSKYYIKSNDNNDWKQLTCSCKVIRLHYLLTALVSH